MKLATLAALGVATLALPVALAAQQPPAGAAPAQPPANPVTMVMRARTMTLQRNLAQAFDSIPAAKFSYKPTPVQQTVGYIAQHLARDNYLFCENFGAMKATVPERERTTPDTVKATWPREELVTQLKASFDFCEKAFAQLDDAKLGEMFTFTGVNGQSRSMPRAQMVVGHLLDMADHYSQIANYMRLNGMVPPTALPRPRS